MYLIFHFFFFSLCTSELKLNSMPMLFFFFFFLFEFYLINLSCATLTCNACERCDVLEWICVCAVHNYFFFLSFGIISYLFRVSRTCNCVEFRFCYNAMQWKEMQKCVNIFVFSVRLHFSKNYTQRIFRTYDLLSVAIEV